MADKNNIMFVTGVQFSKNVLNALNAMTFLFDPNWNVNNSTQATFPVAFFHTKSIHEISAAEIS